MLALGRLYLADWDPEGSKKEADDENENDENTIQVNKAPESNIKRKKKGITREAKASFLEFITFMISDRYSFEQIVRIGSFMKDKFSRADKAITEIGWSPEIIRNLIVHCVAKDIKDSLIQELEASPFSITLDTSTILGDQILVVRVRFLRMEYNSVAMANVPTVHNQIIAVEELEESSTGRTFYEILLRKILFNEKLKKNFVGLCHDGAGSLSGSGIGLVGQLRKNFKAHFFDLHDPCHCYNLAIEDALGVISKDYLRFVEQIHSYFNHSPPRTILLNQIQERYKFQVLGLQKYAATRWLSLADSIKRLTVIWDGLVLYFKENKKAVPKREHKENKEKEEDLEEKNEEEKEVIDTGRVK